MVLYECEACNFSSKIRTHFNRHLKTKKHINNTKNLCSEVKKKVYFPSETLQKPPKSYTFPSNSLQKPPKSEGTYECPNCNKKFSRKDNLERHLNKRCKNAEASYKDLFFEMKDLLENEKKEFRKQIELLLTKVGNTTINNTQNIQLNSYGKEDLSHITDNLKTNLIKMPYGMIPKLIEEVHFNDQKPENKNIVLTNKNDNKIKIFTGSKWIYKNKNETIKDLVDGKYFILDTHYDRVFEKLDEKNKEVYSKFRDTYDDKDNKIFDELKSACELILLNNR